MKSFQEILTGFQEYITSNFTKFDDFSTGNTGQMLLEVFAYYLEQLYYTSTAAFRESFLRTAENYENVVALSRMFGYDPYTALSAIASVSLTLSSTGNTLPKGTEITAMNGAVAVPFFLPSAALMNESPKTLDFVQGRYRSNYSLGVSDGSSNQEYTLPDTNLVYVDGTPFITVTVGGVEWTVVSSLYLNMYVSSNIVEVVDTGSNIRLRFGDGVVGNIPTNGDAILVSYGYDCLGDLGNVPATSITSLPRYSWVQSATNPAAATGGRDRELASSIRGNAYSTFATQNRAVTRADFEGLTKTVAGVRDATVTDVDLETNEITLQIAFDGTVDEATVIENVEDLLDATKLVATTVVLTYPLAQDIFVGLTVKTAVGYASEDVQSDIDDAIDELLLGSSGSVYLSDIYASVTAIEGVEYVVIDSLTIYPSFSTDSDVSCSSFAPKTTLLEDTVLTITCDGSSGYTLSSDVYGALGSGTFGNLLSTSICDIILVETNTTTNGQEITFDLTHYLANIVLDTDKSVSSGHYSFTFVGE